MMMMMAIEDNNFLLATRTAQHSTTALILGEKISQSMMGHAIDVEASALERPGRDSGNCSTLLQA